MIRVICTDPHAAWPPGLVKELDDALAHELLKGPYYVAITDDTSLQTAQAIQKAHRAEDRLRLVQEPCKGCKEKRERIRRARAS